jgi:hypothetical protein
MTPSASQLVLAVVLGAAGASAWFFGLVLGNKRVSDASRRVPMLAIWLIASIVFVSCVALVSLYRPDFAFDLKLSLLWLVLVWPLSMFVLYVFHPLYGRRKR